MAIISVDPYCIKGSLDACLLIQKELDVRFDPGSWMTPYYFYPETEEETAKLIDLLDTFELKYTRLQ